jgi:hypothetical protein
MRPISSHSQQAVPCCRRQPAPRRAAAAGLSAAALIAVAACGSAAGGGPGSTSVTPRQALLAAAAHMQKVTSAVETLSVKTSGAQSGTTTGVIHFQLRPLLLGADLSLAVNGKSTPLKEVLTTSDIYLSAPALTGQTGKPWVKIPLSVLKGPAGATFGALFHSLESDNFTNQTELLTTAKNVRFIGRETVGGTSAIEYAGSVKADSALKALPASYRRALSAKLHSLGTTAISFHVWIDSQNHVRKLAETESVNGVNVNTTVTVTAINQPVHVTIPPASQTSSPAGL